MSHGVVMNTAGVADGDDVPVETRDWYRESGTVVAEAMGVDPQVGLPSDAARERLASAGPNRLDEVAGRSALATFLDQFRNRLILILVGAGVIAFLVSGEPKDPIIIGIVVLFNAVLGFVQERRAEASLAALKGMLVTTARVRRDGEVHEIAADGLVPGDVVLVNAGDRIPADGRWLVTVEVEVNESAFTGESLPVAKSTEALTADVPLADRRSVGFANTAVTRGRGELVVTATGMRTEIGKIADLLEAAEAGPSPLQKQIHDLANRLTLVAATAVTAVLVLELARGTTVADALLSAVALAVAAIPEGLPAVLTVTLAIGTHQLAKRHAIVKRLPSVETLGCTTVICTDKTGTLTFNQMTATRLWFHGTDRTVTGEGYRIEGEIAQPTPALRSLLVPLALCNEARQDGEQIVGDPTEGALLVLAAKGHIDRDAELMVAPRVAEVPFDSTRKYMATFHRRPGSDEVLVYVKGAADIIMARARSLATAAGPVALDGVERARVIEENDRLAAGGLRVLAVATGLVPAAAVPDGVSVDDLDGLVGALELQGLIGLTDPPRPEARDAIAACRQAGIAVKMITGDHATTASAIASSLGLEGGAVTGAQLDEWSDAELSARVPRLAVFARVSPEHKVRLVNVLRGNGEVVAMTGDGVNDAPALKSADIGIAMGISGTEVTKEAATMVLADDNFATIIRAVHGGRTIYENVVKFVSFQLATNLGAIITILAAVLIGIPADGGTLFTPIAILWVNLIMDGPPALALGVDPPAPGSMHRPPRDSSAPILSLRRLGRLLGMGAVMAVGTLGVYAAVAGGLEATDAETAAKAQIMAFTTFVLFQLFNIFNVRSEHASAFTRHSFTNAKLWASLAAVAALQVVVVLWSPAQQLMTGSDATATLSPLDWLLVVAVAALVLLPDEARKLAARKGPMGGFRPRKPVDIRHQNR